MGLNIDTSLADSAEIEVDEKFGGYRVNSELQARSNIWVVCSIKDLHIKVIVSETKIKMTAWHSLIDQRKIESSLYSRYYAEACSEVHLHGLTLGNTAPKKHRSGGEPLATLCPICSAGNRTLDLPRR